MKKLLLAGMVVATLGWSAAAARATGHCCPPVPMITKTKWVEKCVTRYRQEWHTKQVPSTMYKKFHRIIEVPCRYTVMVPRPVMEKQAEVYYRSVLKPVCFEVAKTKCVPVIEKDCNGCPKTRYETICYTEKVCSTITDIIPEIRECMVEVNHFIPQDHDYTARRHVTVEHPETIWHTVRYCVQIPYEVKVLVPVCVCEPCVAPACATPPAVVTPPVVTPPVVAPPAADLVPPTPPAERALPTNADL